MAQTRIMQLLKYYFLLRCLPDRRLLVCGPPGGRGERIPDGGSDGRLLGGRPELPVTAPRRRPRRRREGVADGLQGVNSIVLLKILLKIFLRL